MLGWVDPGGGGVLRFELGRGVPLKPQNPYPCIFKGDFGQKRVPIFKDFPSKIGPFFKNSAIFGVFAKVGPCLRIFGVRNGTHV